MAHSEHHDDEFTELAQRLAIETGFERTFDEEGKESGRAEGTSFKVFQAYVEALSRGEFERGYKKAQDILVSRLAKADRRGSLARLSAAAAANVLDTAVSWAFNKGSRTFAAVLPAYRWLWLIRRLPLRTLWGRQSSLDLRTVMLALALARNRKTVRFPPDGMFEVTSHDGAELARLVGFAEATCEMSRAFRWVGKGGELLVNLKGIGIKGSGGASLQARLKEYDERNEIDNSYGGWGVPLTDVESLGVDPGSPDDGPIGIILARETGRWVAESPESNFERYVEFFVRLDRFLDLLAASGPRLQAKLNDEIFALLPLMVAMREMCAAGELRMESVRRVGYSVHGVDFLRHAALVRALESGLAWTRTTVPDDRIPRTTDEAASTLQSMRGSVSPLRPGPVLVPITGAIVIDWFAASSRLYGAIRFPVTDGSLVEARGRMFEEIVQQQVDSTACAPTHWLRSLIGRQLQAGNQFIGDIDAAASIPDSHSHLVLSCKSYLFSESYQRGEHKTVRNVADRLVEGLATARQLTARLCEQREHFGIPDGEQLIPLLVLPRLLFADSDGCWDRCFGDAESPRNVSSLAEVMTYLRRFDRESSS